MKNAGGTGAETASELFGCVTDYHRKQCESDGRNGKRNYGTRVREMQNAGCHDGNKAQGDYYFLVSFQMYLSEFANLSDPVATAPGSDKLFITSLHLLDLLLKSAKPLNYFTQLPIRRSRAQPILVFKTGNTGNDLPGFHVMARRRLCS